MKLKSAMIRNRGEGTRVGTMEKHGRCQLRTDDGNCQTDPCNTLCGMTLRHLTQSSHDLRGWRRSAEDVALSASSAEWGMARVAAIASVMGMERLCRVIVVRASREPGSFTVRDGAPQRQSSLCSATRDASAVLSP